jgi:hypothetical protein
LYVFRKEKLQIGPSGGSPSQWWAYDLIKEIIGSEPINNASWIHDSLLTDSNDTQV